MPGSHRTYGRSLGTAGREPDGGLRGFLFLVVITMGALMFALALLPPLAAGGRAVERFADEFDAIGADIDLTFPRLPERSTIYAADGSVLATLYFKENRKIVRLRQVSDIARRAVLAIEDDRFYEHHGIDYKGIIRALVTNVSAGDIEQGASTITQQLARNVFKAIGTDQTLARKVQEAKVAMRLEAEYSKDKILEIYLNEVYYGRGVYGIGTAAEYYFGKKTRKLNLPQAALLAGLIAAPETYSPVNDRAAARARRNVVIDRMRGLGWITDERADRAKEAPLGLDITEVGNDEARFPFFVQYLKQRILSDKRFGETYGARKRALFQGGLHIYTTLEPDLQEAGERVVRNHLPARADPESAIASVDVASGAIKALVGGKNFEASQVNLATGQGGTGRQSGSAFKPFTLVAALMEGIPVGKVYRAESGQVVDCTPYGPANYRAVNAGDGGGSGYVNLLTATANSINAVFVQLAIDVGPPKIVEVANAMGIRSELDPFCSITLGVEEVTPLEMASAFTTLANHGVHCRPFAITRVEDRKGNALINRKSGRCDQVIPREVADDVAGMLRLVVSQGTGTAAALGQWPVFGKTGTTNDSADVWFDGCTAQICTATWVGHPEERIPMPGAYGGTVAAPIWHDFMMVAMRGLPALSLPGPPAPPTGEVPGVVGKPQAQAEKILAKANFTTQAEEVRSTEPAGIVVAQSPGGGATAVQGSIVTIQVSNGKAPVAKVPGVLGMAQAEAKKALQDAGFSVAVESMTTDKKPLDGTVASQSPGSGEKAKVGTTVTIVVYDYEKPPKDKGDDKGGGKGGGGGGGGSGDDRRDGGGGGGP
ncbi:MAG: PBP1A family penicillin-binding protein [Actinomycetota bacterium]